MHTPHAFAHEIVKGNPEMEVAGLVLDFIRDMSWQVVALTAVYLLRAELRQVLQRLQEARIPGAGEYRFYEIASDKEEKEARRKSGSRVDAKWANVGNIYWLGHDLMWTIDAALRNAGKKHLIHGLRQVEYHLRALELSDESPLESAGKLIANVQVKLESDLDVGFRQKFAKDIDTLRDEIGVYMEVEQSSFLASPQGNDTSSESRLARTKHSSETD